jgi:hypothetical protein
MLRNVKELKEKLSPKKDMTDKTEFSVDANALAELIKKSKETNMN